MSDIDETIDRFMLITNVEDRDVAINILNMTNWDLEEAVLYHIDSQDIINMKNTDEQKKDDLVLGKEENVFEESHDVDRKDLNKELKNERFQKNEGSVLEKKKEEEKKLKEKSRRKEKKKSSRSSKEKKTHSSYVGDSNERVENKESIKNTNKKNEKIKRETTFLGILKPVVSLISPFFKNFGNIISFILNFLSAFLLSAYTESDFNSYYERKYGPFHVNFFKGSFKNAVLEAKKSSKLLVIYCHLETEGNHFCEYIFKDSRVKDFIDAHFIVYAECVTDAKVPIIQFMKTRISFPALLVVIPLEESNVKVLKYINAHPSVSQVIDMLSGCIEQMCLMEETMTHEQHVLREVFHSGNANLERNDAHLNFMSNIGLGLGLGLGSTFSSIRTGQNISNSVPASTELGKVGPKVGQTAHSNEDTNGLVKRNVGGKDMNVRTNGNSHIAFRLNTERNLTDRLIREEQDREYQEALLMDQMREEKKKEEQRLKMLKSDVKRDIKEERKKNSKYFNLQINEGDQITRICSRFPNGKRIQRNFSVEHTVKNIYEWVEYSEFLEKDITVPYKFELICGHSKMVLEKNEKQIKDFDLIPNAILNVKSLDSSDEE